MDHFRVAFSLCVTTNLHAKPFKMKMCSTCQFTFMEIKLILMWKVLHKDSLWKRGKMQLGNGLLQDIHLNRMLTCSCGKINTFNLQNSCKGTWAVNKCCLKLLFAQIYDVTGKTKEAHKFINALAEEIDIVCHLRTSFLTTYHIRLFLSTFCYIGAPVVQISLNLPDIYCYILLESLTPKIVTSLTWKLLICFATKILSALLRMLFEVPRGFLFRSSASLFSSVNPQKSGQWVKISNAGFCCHDLFQKKNIQFKEPRQCHFK